MGMDWVKEDTVTSLVVGGECLIRCNNVSQAHLKQQG